MWWNFNRHCAPNPAKTTDALASNRDSSPRIVHSEIATTDWREAGPAGLEPATSSFVGSRRHAISLILRDSGWDLNGLFPGVREEIVRELFTPRSNRALNRRREFVRSTGPRQIQRSPRHGGW